MTVKELIIDLLEFDPDLPVHVRDSAGDWDDISCLGLLTPQDATCRSRVKEPTVRIYA